MDSRYAPKFARQPSNTKYLQNDHFLSQSTHQPPRNELNMTESNLIEMKDHLFPTKPNISKTLEQDF
jgi:hypothetical protein